MKRIIVIGLTLMVPLAAAAQTVADIIGRASSVVNLVIPLLASLAFAASLYGIVRFIASAGNEEKRSEAKKYVLYGLIGMFVIVAFWGILTVVANTFFGGSIGSPISISGIIPSNPSPSPFFPPSPSPTPSPSPSPNPNPFPTPPPSPTPNPTPNPNPTPTPCTPATCSSLNKQCGIWSDNCDSEISCGDCDYPQICDSQGQCVTSSSPTQTCTSLGGSCKTNACSTYGSTCTSLSAGQCTSGNCCSGSCGSTGTLLPDNESVEVNMAAGTERTYIIRVNSDTMTDMSLDMTGATNETNFDVTLTFPDGLSFSRHGEGTSNGVGLRFRSKKTGYYPNVDYDYLPPGDYIIKITVNAQSRFIIRSTVYSSNQTPANATVLPWGMNPINGGIIFFSANETKTFIARITSNVRGFEVIFLPQTDFTVTCSFRLPFKSDGTYYQFTPQMLSNPNIQISEDSSGTLISGLSASYDGSIDLRIWSASLAGVVLDPFIYHGDFVITLTADKAGWGSMTTSLNP